MANVKISALPEKSTVSNSDYVPIDNGVITQKIAAVNMVADRMEKVASPVSGDILTVDSEGQAVDSGVQVSELTYVETITATKEWANDIDIVAQKNVKTVNVCGYVLLDANTYTADSMPLLNLSEHPPRDLFVFDNAGDVYRIRANGDLVFHANTTISSAQFRFFNFAFCS